MMCTLTSWPYVQAIACIGFEPPALVAYCFTAFQIYQYSLCGQLPE